jgi:hypothetical protein
MSCGMASSPGAMRIGASAQTSRRGGVHPAAGVQVRGNNWATTGCGSPEASSTSWIVNLRRPGHHPQRTWPRLSPPRPRRRQLSAAFRVPPRPRRGHTLVLTADHHAGRCPGGGLRNCHPEPAHAGRARLNVNAASAQPAPKTLARLAVASGQGLCEGAGAVGVAGLCSVITAWICRSATCGPNCVMHRPWNSRRKIAAMRARCWRFERTQCDVGASRPVRSDADKGQVPRDDPDAASGLRRLGSGRRSTTPNARASTAPRPRFGCRRTWRAARRVQRRSSPCAAVRGPTRGADARRHRSTCNLHPISTNPPSSRTR